MLTFLIILGSILVVMVLIYIIEPFLYALFFSWILELFVKNPPYVNMEEEFPEGKLLKDNWKTILEELQVVLKNIDNIPKFHEVDKLQSAISAKDKVAWRTFILKGFNKWVDHNCAQVPKTTALLKQLPRVSTAMFSIIDPGKHIPPHYGFFKSVLRYHLGLIIPKGDVYITVGGQDYHWKQGEDVLFDDTYRHEVWNKTGERRVVLFLDVLREKGLPKYMQRINAWMFKVLTNSAKLRKAAAKAEVTQDVTAK